MSETIKIQLPESIADITLNQYQQFIKLQEKADTLSEQGMAERLISLFTGIKKQDVKKIVISDYETIIKPIVKEDSFGNYSIEAYGNIEERSNEMLNCPMHIVNGSLLFFLNLSKDLKNCMERYTAEVVQRNKQQTTSLNGDGIQAQI